MNSRLATVTYECSATPLFIAPIVFDNTPFADSGSIAPAASCRAADIWSLGCNDVDSNGHIDIPAGIWVVPGGGFTDCNALTSVTIPASVTSIDAYAFTGSVNLASVTFEAGSRLNNIGFLAFAFTALRSIDIPPSVHQIADWAFGMAGLPNRYLTSVTFACSSHPLSIASNAFDSTDVTSLALPPGATYEGDVPVTSLTSCTAAEQTDTHLQCGAGLYVKHKHTAHESCAQCPAGKFSAQHTTRNRRCKKCPINTYAAQRGASRCMNCPEDFNTRGKRGRKQCYDRATGRSMTQLQTAMS
jgi:hypothetical protein